MRATSAYNAILGRLGQNLLCAVASAYHKKMKFITPKGVGEVKRDQPQSRECYATALKGKNALEALPNKLLDLRGETHITFNKPSEDLISLLLYNDNEEKLVIIGSSLSDSIREELIQFFRENADIFAWTPADMPGIDPKVSVHKLSIDPTCKPVKQKRRHFAPKRQHAIREEVEKLLKADFIQEIGYPNWLANVVMVKKANGYNQIRMYEADIPKTSFVTDQGIYCYRVMLFGLKNAGAAHQRLINKLFRKQIGRNMKVYVDDMLVKSKKAPDHISDPRETFQVLQDYSMKLNPTKCAFGVVAGKFFVFMVSQRRIEANPEKIQAIIELNPPTTIREIQRLTGMVAALGRFISKSADKCLPFFNAIKGIKTAPWTPECQAVFEELKRYLVSPPLLTKPEPGDELMLYLSVQGTYEARDEQMSKYLSKAHHLPDKFKSFEIVRVPRTENGKADVLSRLTAFVYTALGSIYMGFLKKSSIDSEIVELIQIDHEPCWMDEIINYLQNGKLPKGKKEARKVVQRSTRFSFDGKNLYKRSYTLPYLKCLRPTDVPYTLQETHKGLCGEHLGGKALAIKVLLRGLYWPTLRHDALDLVRK
ncbi:uncharacterized protein LOC143856034 [Tasmannia lanceolata]|uniref:uncharacterized protein LOC143856034 n=1 Tax=Tasmannia lanceolata TaxID=3420 RepID=UPI004063BD1D